MLWCEGFLLYSQSVQFEATRQMSVSFRGDFMSDFISCHEVVKTLGFYQSMLQFSLQEKQLIDLKRVNLWRPRTLSIN